MSNDTENGAENGVGNATDNQRLDGNAAAGLLREIFTMEMTTALGTCGGCGKSGTVGELVLYGGEIGAILRCPGCDHLLICITHTPEGYWVDLSGLKVLRIVQTS